MSIADRWPTQLSAIVAKSRSCFEGGANRQFAICSSRPAEDRLLWCASGVDRRHWRNWSRCGVAR
jgi:hypothetical protein